MSLVRTAKEWIESLQKEDPDTIFVGNLYSADFIREDLENRASVRSNLDGRTNKELLESFLQEYNPDEDTAYFEALNYIIDALKLDKKEA